MAEKSKFSEGDEIVFKFSPGKSNAHVKYASGGISGRLVPLVSFDAVVAALKEDHAL